MSVHSPHCRDPVLLTLIINPRADQEFVDRARALRARGLEHPMQLERALREEYPRAIVRRGRSRRSMIAAALRFSFASLQRRDARVVRPPLHAQGDRLS